MLTESKMSLEMLKWSKKTLKGSKQMVRGSTKNGQEK